MDTRSCARFGGTLFLTLFPIGESLGNFSLPGPGSSRAHIQPRWRNHQQRSLEFGVFEPAKRVGQDGRSDGHRRLGPWLLHRLALVEPVNGAGVDLHQRHAGGGGVAGYGASSDQSGGGVGGADGDCTHGFWYGCGWIDPICDDSFSSLGVVAGRKYDLAGNHKCHRKMVRKRCNTYTQKKLSVPRCDNPRWCSCDRRS